MRLDLKILLVAVIMFIISGTLFGAYLQFEPQEVYQPDGTKLDLFATGDEYYNWMHDKDGYTLKQNDKGWYVYLDKDSRDELIFTNLIVGVDNPAESNLVPWTNISPQKMGEIRTTVQREMQDVDNGRAPTSGTINNLVVFIRFSDQSEFGQTISTYSSMFNGTSGNTMQNYFKEASYDQLNISTTFYPTPSTMVVSWQDTAHNRSYFMPYNASTNPTGYDGDTERRLREHTLLVDAVNGISSQVPVGLNLDGDGDGKVDNVCFIIQGATTAWATLLWPHRWALYTYTVNINGKRVYDYNFQLSNSLASSGVGVLCHEMFHSLGAPDLYHYTSNGITPVGGWDIMQSNYNPPQHMSAYMKYKYGHWISSIPTLYTSGTYTLNQLTSSTGQCYRINSPNSASQYFVVEFRKKTGTFESSLPGTGMIIYRIDPAYNGNADGPPDEVYAFRLNGTPTVNGTINSATFSSETGRTTFNNTTNPYCFLQDGTLGDISISSVGSSAGSTISFYFNIDNPPLNLTAESESGTVVLNWQSPVSGTPDSYKIYRDGGYLDTTTNLNYTDTNVVLNNTYTYYVTAMFSNPTSETTASNSVNVTVLNIPKITIGTGTATGQSLPMEPYYGYTYSQSIYLQSEINIADNCIKEIAWQYNGNSSWTDEVKIYMGHTSLTSFASLSSWVPLANLTQVYDGDISTSTTPGWITITLDTPFYYNNTHNLVIALDENTSGWHSSSDEFYCTSVTGNRSIYYYNDTTNPNPASPPITGSYLSLKTYIPNVKLIFDSYPLLSANPVGLTYGNVLIGLSSSLDFTLTNQGGGTLSGNITTPSGYSVSVASRVTEDSAAKSDTLSRNTLAYSLTADQSQTYTIVFTPSAAQSYNADVTITSSDPDNPTFNLALTGTGVTPVFNAPASVTAAVYHAAVNLSWTAPVGSSGIVTGYNVYRNNILLTPSPITETSFLNTGLTNGTSYPYYVKAVFTNPAGVSGSSETVNAVPVPLPPQNLSGIEGNHTAALTWQAPALGIPAYYRIFRNSVFIANQTETTFVDSNLINGVSYSYFVIAYYTDPIAESAASNTINVIPNPVVVVTVASGSVVSQGLPMEPYQGYTYSQSIYLQSEINHSNDEINRLYWYYGGGTEFTDAIKIYMGHTDLSEFPDNSSWIPLSSMTMVYDGTITTTPTAGWIEIILTTPFAYNNIQNLVIAVDENTSTRHTDFDEFYCYDVGLERSLVFYSLFTNPNPASPPTTGTNLYTRTSVPNLKLHMTYTDIVIPAVPVPYINVALDGVTITWESVTNAIAYKVYKSESAFGDYQLVSTVAQPLYYNGGTQVKAFYKIVSVIE